MTYIASWEEFSKAAERLYLNNPMKVVPSRIDKLKYDSENEQTGQVQNPTPHPEQVCRFVIKYRHCDGKLCVKITDDAVCLQYRTEHNQDVKKLEKLTNQLMRHMASKEK